MNIAYRVFSGIRFAVLILAIAVSVSTNTTAQEVTDEHLVAAKAAMKATGATSRLDKILPEVAAFTKTGLIANRPDIEAEISIIVDEVALSLASRRGPLEGEVAVIYAKLFTQEELNSIGTFFSSEAGEKFLRLTPNLFREIDEASRLWRGGITRDMAKQVQEKLVEQGLQ